LRRAWLGSLNASHAETHRVRVRTDDKEFRVRGRELAKKIAEVVDHRCSGCPCSRSVVRPTGM
jgi:hypothetical protein